MGHREYRLFMETYVSETFLIRFFTIFICFQMGMCSQKYVFVSKGQMQYSRFPGRYSAIMAINSFDLRPMLLTILMHFNGQCFLLISRLNFHLRHVNCLLKRGLGIGDEISLYNNSISKIMTIYIKMEFHDYDSNVLDLSVLECTERERVRERDE